MEGCNDDGDLDVDLEGKGVLISRLGDIDGDGFLVGEPTGDCGFSDESGADEGPLVDGARDGAIVGTRE